MRQVLLVGFLGPMLACGGASSDQNATPAQDTAAPAPAVVQPDTQPMPQADVTITTDTRSYRAGDPVQLRIVNNSTRRFTFNPCTRALEREDDVEAGKWAEVREDRMCAMIAHVLEPNATRTESTELGEELGPGRYRMLIRFANDAKSAKTPPVTAYSAPFTVTSTR